MGRAEGVMAGDCYGWLEGCVEGGLMGESLKKECGWVHMTEICLGYNWVCARDGPWRLSGKFLSWIRAG